MNLPPLNSFVMADKSYALGPLECVIETKKHSIRKGRGWMNVSPADYGYIRNYKGADGDDIDCYIGPSIYSRTVYVVDQGTMKDSGVFDEHKCMLGYSSRDEALRDYLAGHSHGHKIFWGITEVSMPKFISWLETGDHSKPFGRRFHGYRREYL